MGTKISHEELNILNNLLPIIPIKDAFTISALHAENVLKPLYPRGDGAIDLAKYDPVRNDFTKRGIYSNITNYLIEQNFAVSTDNKSNPSEIILTDAGLTVRAYRDVEKYFNSFSKTTIEEIEKRIPIVLEKISPFGEFAIVYHLPKTIVFDAADFVGLSEEDAMKIKNEKLEQKEELILIQELKVKDEEVLQYLVDHGFAINRHDIISQNKLYRQLTDRGRKLKECGSIELLNRQERAEEDNKHHQRKRDVYLFWVVLFGAIGTCISAVYDATQTTVFYSSHHADWQMVAYFLSGLLIGLLIMFLLSIMKNISKKQKQS